MLSKQAQLALLDIRHNVLAARRFTANLSFDEFRQSDWHLYAVTRALEIISEAARRLPNVYASDTLAFPGNRLRG